MQNRYAGYIDQDLFLYKRPGNALANLNRRLKGNGPKIVVVRAVEQKFYTKPEVTNEELFLFRTNGEPASIQDTTLDRFVEIPTTRYFKRANGVWGPQVNANVKLPAQLLRNIGFPEKPEKTDSNYWYGVEIIAGDAFKEYVERQRGKIGFERRYDALKEF